MATISVYIFLYSLASSFFFITRKLATIQHMPTAQLAYDANCRACPRLAGFLDQVQAKHPHFFCKPVPPFGDSKARFLIVGLAPGLKGANASGRPFTGDRCSDFLYGALYRAGFATQPRSISADDQQRLLDLRISNAVKCLPPDNKPTLAEIRECNRFLRAELTQSGELRVVLALGGVAHRAVVEALGRKAAAMPFAMGAVHALPGGLTLFNCYHVSPLNTNTGRLNAAQFDAILMKIKAVLEKPCQ